MQEAVGRRQGELTVAGFRDLKVYQAAFELAFDVFEITKEFPTDEKFGLSDQIRRSSRGTAAFIAEAYRKPAYPKSFVSKKLVDADGEATETQVWLDFALRFGYLSIRKHEELIQRSEEIGRMLGGMLKHPEKFCDAKP